jgi:predicted dehydrogenase
MGRRGEPAAAEAPAPPGVGATRTWGTSAVGYLRQYADVVEAVRTGRLPAVTGDDGRNAVEIVTAAYAADLAGRAVELGGVSG